MHASLATVFAGLLALNVAALPSPNSGTHTTTWGSSSPTGAPVCAGSKYTCKSDELLAILTCTNILNGVAIGIPISIGRKERDVGVEERDIEARTSNKDGDYCCTKSGLLTLSCINVANGVEIYLPISIL